MSTSKTKKIDNLIDETMAVVLELKQEKLSKSELKETSSILDKITADIANVRDYYKKPVSFKQKSFPDELPAFLT